MKIVLAGNYQQYMRWRRDNNMGPHDSIYVMDVEVLMGRRLEDDDEIIEVGTFWDRKDASDIVTRLQIMEAMRRHPSG